MTILFSVVDRVSKPAAIKPTTTSTTDKSQKETTNKNDKPVGRMQEQEITSTTQDTVDIPEPGFQVR